MKRTLVALALLTSFTAFAADPAPAADKPVAEKATKKKAKKAAKADKKADAKKDAKKDDAAKPADAAPAPAAE